jgi:tetratricopeptide (TPR) repeat protein
MDHPNIARVLDAGATDSGRPYFVMELVKGEPITEFCDRSQLPPRQRLELFAQVCHAVQHAHTKGVIHRDIKPSNVLVAVYDTTPVVKVIDFGVAKALGQELTEKTLFTGFAQLLGTPLYMSPEQAGRSALDVDTRSDIYSLGVLLYELLTGTTPFDKERFRKAAQDEIRRIIREEEPPRPSTRLSESHDSLASISAQRHTEPAKLTRLVRGELDWMVMKALEKDRGRRYETANGFAKDIERYLAGEAVQAVPPSAAYRLRKFARRNKGPVVAAAVVLLTLVAGTIGMSIGLVRAQQAWRAVAARAEGERLAKEAAERREAETELAAARQRQWDSELAGLCRDVQRYPGSPNALAARGKWLLTRGRFDEAERDYARLVQLHPADHWHWYYRGCLLAYLGREKDHREHCRAMLGQFADAADFATIERTTKPALLMTGGAGSDVEELARRAERARQLAPDSPVTALLIGLAECRVDRYEQAAGWLEKCRTLQQDLAARTIAADAYLAIARHRLGQEQEARAALERAARRAGKDLPPAGSGYLDTNTSAGMENWLVAQTALREAEQLVLGRQPPPAPQALFPPVPPPPPSPTAPFPFREKAAALPGVVQAEDFDEGGEGIAYHDLTYQSFGARAATAGDRVESVDLDDCADAGGGRNVGRVLTGEWLAYTVEVKESGEYDLSLRLSSGSGDGKLHVEFGGKDVTGPVDVPETGNRNTWTTVTVKAVRLNAGRQVMRVVFDAAAGMPAFAVYVCNLNWIEARRSP